MSPFMSGIISSKAEQMLSETGEQMARILTTSGLQLTHRIF